MTRSGMVCDNGPKEVSALASELADPDVQVVGERPVLRLQSGAHHELSPEIHVTHDANDGTVKAPGSGTPDLQEEQDRDGDPGDSSSSDPFIQNPRQVASCSPMLAGGKAWRRPMF